jgi:RNase P subunit RPR2
MERKKGIVERIANERVAILFSMAEKCIATEPELSASYVNILEHIMKHYHLKPDSRLKGRICKHCHVVLVPGFNCTVRIRSSSKIVAYTCSKCKSDMRILYG